MTIATATVKENVEFYFDVFQLDRWFDFDKVTFDDGSFPENRRRIFFSSHRKS